MRPPLFGQLHPHHVSQLRAKLGHVPLTAERADMRRLDELGLNASSKPAVKTRGGVRLENWITEA